MATTSFSFPIACVSTMIAVLMPAAWGWVSWHRNEREKRDQRRTRFDLRESQYNRLH